MRFEVADNDGVPRCPIDGDPVAKKGHFCGILCYTHFQVLVSGAEIVDMEVYIDVSEQPWYQEAVDGW